MLSALQVKVKDKVKDILSSTKITKAFKSRNPSFKAVPDDTIRQQLLGRIKFRDYADVQSMLADPLASRLHGLLSVDQSMQDEKVESSKCPVTSTRGANGQSSHMKS
jgi:hypothetical protein